MTCDQALPGQASSSRQRALVYILGATVLIAGCGGPNQNPQQDAESAGFFLQAIGGTYNDGSGRQRLALLATLRDPHGRGPREPWTATLSDEAGPLPVSFVYEEPAGAQGGSQAAWWWSSINLSAGASYRLSLAPTGGNAATVSFPAPESAGLALPHVELSPDGTRLDWASDPGATRYACRVFSGETLQLSRSTTEPMCALDGLPPGNYSASVLAFSVDLETLAAKEAQRPELPEAFHVSEGRLAFVLGGTSDTTFRAHVVGGALSYGRAQPGLAVWLSLTRPDETPATEGWSVDLVGPGLPPESPLRFTYPPGARQHLLWSYDTLALAGRYALTARSGTRTLSATFDLVLPDELPVPTYVMATPSPGGGLSVSWRAVEGALAYYVSVWDFAAGTQVTSIWTSTPEAYFGNQTFTVGQSYDVYVAATSVDLGQSALPARVSVSENTYYPQTFIAQ